MRPQRSLEATPPDAPAWVPPAEGAGLIRLYYETESGRVVEVENRPDDRYTDDNVTRSEMSGVSTLIVDGATLGGVALDRLEVVDDEVRAGDVSGPEIEQLATARRIDELRVIDKSTLSDEEWLKLYREYVTLTGGF